MTARGRPNNRPTQPHAQVSLACRTPTPGWTRIVRAMRRGERHLDYLEAAGEELLAAIAAGEARYLGVSRGFHVYEVRP